MSSSASSRRSSSTESLLTYPTSPPNSFSPVTRTVPSTPRTHQKYNAALAIDLSSYVPPPSQSRQGPQVGISQEQLHLVRGHSCLVLRYAQHGMSGNPFLVRRDCNSLVPGHFSQREHPLRIVVSFLVRTCRNS